ncbi:glucosamine-6-phosphate deaminase [Alicyclobacillus acidoterrestris]|uniref:glucosamine-6-phosphate deaminase n=1 Tax=Alicyclobacillus suci TaxID=2816080 RepID=UPI00119307C8|nr:glucosamine-6-phosphate deaminase [Alicyclobacillus suci]GEO25179.1 glucosamine-6-phosphate deaminase [Alicyclobacillus acidoterrestris]
MEVRVFPDAYGAALYTATLVETTIRQLSSPVLGLATGGTMIPVYQHLVQFHRRGLRFEHVTTINLDEYIGLEPTDRHSYHAFMREHFFDHVDLPLDCRHIPSGATCDLTAACQAYDEILRAHPIDLQLLGIGVNGHIGFNEPADHLKPHTHVVELTEDTIRQNARFFDAEERVPTRAITMGLQSILFAKRIVLLAVGASKAQAVREAIIGDIRTTVPASLLQLHPQVTFVLDEAAAQQLP